MEPLRLAIWDLPPADFLAAGVASGAVSQAVVVERAAPAVCRRRLEEGAADVALVPTLHLLRDPGAFDLVPGAALSTWRYPFARLLMRSALQTPPATLAFDPVHEQEILVAAIVLKEHYGATPTLVPRPDTTRDALAAAPEDAVLLVGPEVPTLQADRLAMDLGQEWFELTHYPMPWGLFATRREAGREDVVRLVRALARTAEAQRGVWAQARETSPSLHAFYTDDLRVRFDDLVTAGLTAYVDYLFYLGVLSEQPDFRFVQPPAEDEGDEGSPLL